MKTENKEEITNRILVKNNQFIAVNKLCGEPVQTDPTGDRSLLQKVTAYCHHPVHIVNRLDRPASGIVLFAKSAKAMTALSRQFQSNSVVKEYLAAVDAIPEPKSGMLDHMVVSKKKGNKSFVVEDSPPEAQRCRMSYRFVASLSHYHLLYIQLLTGRHHQIRAQLASLGCHIKGDVKYGARRGNPDRGIHLHAWRLSFLHPVSGEPITLEVKPPVDPVWDACVQHLEDFNFPNETNEL